MTLALPEPLNNAAQFNQFRQMTPSVSLSRLIDFSIQRTYHELEVLADLLKVKSDQERKIEIVSFANRTRQTFIRLLALVKWAGSASKVEKCTTIVSFLDKQTMLFTDTADVLVKMARESLVSARLPSFQLPAAVEVLTLGTYSRLPTCIRERIVPPDPITPAEKRATLLRLNQIIQQRLVSSSLPNQMRNLKIENGRVTFHANYEFELCLTLMGDSASIPWRVLGIEILVVDKETGDGKDLVHPLQINYLQELIQSRLIDNNKPIIDAFNVLHSFCLSLQLEVLHAQAVRLSRERLGDFIRIEEYSPGKRLAILYWRDLSVVDSKHLCKLTVEIDSQDQTKPLQVTHRPELGAKESVSANEAIKSDHLSIEKLLIHTTHERAKQSLAKLRDQLTELRIGEMSLGGCPPLLEISFLYPCMQSEKLLVCVDMLTGVYLAHIPQFEDCPLVSRIQLALKDSTRTKTWMKDLRIWVLKERCRKTVESLPVQVHESLPLGTKVHPIVSSQSAKIFFQFNKHTNNFLMVVFEESPDTLEIVQKYYLMAVVFNSLDGIETQSAFDQPKLFANVLSVYELDMLCLFKPKVSSDENVYDGFKKRKSHFGETGAKKPKASGFVPNLAYLISFCEEKLIYGALSAELQRRSICHQVRVANEPGNTHLVDLVQFPPNPTNPPSKLQLDLLNSNIRLQGKGSKIWNVSFSFANCPIVTSLPVENVVRRMVYLMYDFSSGSQVQITQMVEELLGDWTAMEKIYDVVLKFSKVAPNFANVVELRSFTYKKLFMTYGPNKSFVVAIYWKSTEKRFQLTFGVTGVGSCNSNPHVAVASQLQHEFNQTHSIANLIQTLAATLEPLLTLLSLTSIPIVGFLNKPQYPVQTFVITPQTSTHLRLLYRSMYCLDIVIQLDGLIAIRDGAYSLFDKGKVLEDLTPIQGLKTFLSRFVDKSATQMRRLSQTEDDNPPSPVLDSVESYLFSANQVKTASPSVPDSGMSGLRSAGHMSGPSLNSNPNTPASPHTSILSQVGGYVASPSTAYSMASPPSHGHGGVHASGQMHPAPSPASLPSGSHPEPSPANMFGVNSPMNPLHAPSPSFLPTPSPGPSAHMQSPASNYMSQNQSGHDPSQVNSPFQSHGPTSGMSMASPGAAVWPGSPSVIPRPSPSRPHPSMQSPASCGQPPGLGQSPQTPTSLHPMQAPPAPIFSSASRMLPPRGNWAASNPTLLTHQGFDTMCRSNSEGANVNSIYGSLSQTMSQIDKFLGCVFMRRHLHRVITGDENMTNIPTSEPGVHHFRNETMQFKITLNPMTMQSLHLKIVANDQFKSQWMPDELEVLERFFELKVVCAPYKPNAFLAYNRLINAPFKGVLKDCIQLMKLELSQDRSAKWTLQWCLTISPSAPTASLPGMSAIVMFQNTTMLFFIQFTKVSLNSPIAVEPMSVVVPFVYDMTRNVLKVAERQPSTTFLNVVNNHLSRFYQYANEMPSGECTLFSAIRDGIMMSDLIQS